MEKAEFQARLAQARDAGDRNELERLISDIQVVPSAWARSALFSALELRRQFSPSRQSSTLPWLKRYSLPPPDGRPLHRYRVDDKTFDQLWGDLKDASQRGRYPLRDAALFVLWASEWFRRTYAGDTQRWKDLGQAIGLELDQAGWRQLADEGLEFWRIPPLRGKNAQYRLVAIAQQGGFPVAAFDKDQGGWALKFLQRLIGHLLTESSPSLETALSATDALQDAIPTLWRRDEIKLVSAELALSVVGLRQFADENGAVDGLVSAWLDKHRPNWRESLPLNVAAESGRGLFDRLISADRLKIGRDAVRARRRLEFGPRVRTEQVELELDGFLESADPTQKFTALADTWSRLRLFAAESLARYVSTELGVVEMTDDKHWRCMPTAPHRVFDVPFNVPIMVELRGEGFRVAGPFLMPGGDTVPAGLRVCTGESAASDQLPQHLIVVGTGSGGYRAKRLFLDVPKNWVVRPKGAAPSCQDVSPDAVGDHHQWLIDSETLVESERGDTFLVRPGQSGDQRDQISLFGSAPEGYSLESEGRLIVASPTVRVRDAGADRFPRASEIWWRGQGDRDWRAFSGQALIGPCEFSWRDPQTRHIRARDDAVVLPEGFKLQRQVSGDTLTLKLEGWPHAAAMSSGIPFGDRSWQIALAGTKFAHVTLILTAPGSMAPIRLKVALPHHAWMYRWSGEAVTPKNPISISTLRRFVARAPGQCDLRAELRMPSGAVLPQSSMSWRFEGELPLSLIADDAASLLRASGHIDATVRLSFLDGHSNRWIVSEFEHSLSSESKGLLIRPSLSEPSVRVVGRMLGDPVVERDFGTFTDIDSMLDKPIVLPRLRGPWLIYLRSAERVMSRPKFVSGDELISDPVSELGAAMLCMPAERDNAMDVLVRRAVRDPADDANRAVILSIIDLAISLNGLPASTFDIFKWLEREPLLGPLMLFSAKREHIPSIVALADGLQMSWCLIAQDLWQRAFETQGRLLMDQFPDHPTEVARSLNGKRNDLIRYEPVLAPLLTPTKATDTRQETANAFLNRASDRIRTTIENPFRASYEQMLPKWPYDPGFWRALDAPIIAGLAAQGRIDSALGEDCVACIKDIARTHPRYFNAAFAVQLMSK